MDPFLKGTKGGVLIGEGTEPDSLAISKNDLQSEHHVGDPTVARHAVANTALIHHGPNHHRRAVGSKVRQHQTVLPQGVMNSVDAGATLGDDILERTIDLQDFVHAEHVQKNSPFERRADAHAHPAFSDYGDLVFVGKPENLGNGVITSSIRFDTDDNVRQRPIRAVGKGVLVINFVDGIVWNESWADYLSSFCTTLAY